MSVTGTRYLITGANGFVGKRLVSRLLEDPQTLAVTRFDISFESDIDDPRVRSILGSIANDDAVNSLCGSPLDAIFHLACVPGGAAAANFDLGKSVNLDGTIKLLEAVRQLPAPPVFVYTSSVGIFGMPPAVITDDTPPSPVWSYGAHKAACEPLIADYTRKGWIDGRTVRLPAIVPRPLVRNGSISIFQSDLLHELSAGREYVCPVSAEAWTWWMSLECCVSNLMRAAVIEPAALKPDRTYTLPVLRTQISAIVEGLALLFGSKVLENVRYEPIPDVEKMFGMLPPVVVPLAEEVGFHNDGTVEQMLRSALALQ